ncbi:hypothetical protein BZG36_03855 [Bifiguratus adelaidae]|uniref:LIM interaction domain-containing protein n=1 Tax=Bifiguratus adelaidae TaxID=1938954 RepID=A0A261XWI5_9FUNG|nr:hypothetical protein BZG36_03855 [Bifiguratus adelaidae]
MNNPGGMQRGNFSAQRPMTFPGAANGQPSYPAFTAGPGVIKILQLGDFLGSVSQHGTVDITQWKSIVSEFFSERAVLRHDLLNAAQGNGQSCEIPYPLLPRYFSSHYENSITSIKIVLEGAFETVVANGVRLVEARDTSLYYTFQNGCQVLARGPLRVTLIPTYPTGNYKIATWDFTTVSHNEFVPRSACTKRDFADMLNDSKDSIKSKAHKNSLAKLDGTVSAGYNLPESVVDGYGLPERVSRYLRIAAVLGGMRELMQLSVERGWTPSQSLANYPQLVRDAQIQQRQRMGVSGMPMMGNGARNPGEDAYNLSGQIGMLNPAAMMNSPIPQNPMIDQTMSMDGMKQEMGSPHLNHLMKSPVETKAKQSPLTTIHELPDTSEATSPAAKRARK